MKDFQIEQRMVFALDLMEGDRYRRTVAASLHMAQVLDRFFGGKGLLEGLCDGKSRRVAAGQRGETVVPAGRDLADRFLQLGLRDARRLAFGAPDDDVDAGHAALRER